ncbi:uncharacterized protein LOC134812814 isoform X2 [Bolinopsis microptera]|uniref:uncharacterized protein LOC134812814 isoform X2 n=1 Tax=Bolinopsis microptera TaxID=2820187 RepID=UPI0030790951
MTTASRPSSYQNKLPRSRLGLVGSEPMAKLSSRTHFPSLDQEKPRRSETNTNMEKISTKVSRKKGDQKNNPVTSPPPSASSSRKRGGNTGKSKSSSSKNTAESQVSLVNVIRLQRSNSSKCSLKLKDEEPAEPQALRRATVELKSGNNFYLPKRKLIHKPLEPFKLFINEKHALAKLVWLYLLESQMPFQKINITSKEGAEATSSVPSYCKHCIFVDGDNSMGQPTAIIRHICNNYTNNLLMGADTSQISQGFSWLHWAVSVLHRDLFYLNNGQLKRGATKDTTNELVKSSLDSVSLYFDMLDKIFTSRDYLLGSVAWFCDSAVALILEDASSLSLSSWPKVLDWLERVKEQPNWSVVTAL